MGVFDPIGPEEGALLDAIAESPDDLAPKMVYADWLQDRGDPHGELIVLQAAEADLVRREPKLAEIREGGQSGMGRLFRRVRRALPGGDDERKQMEVLHDRVRALLGEIDLSWASAFAPPVRRHRGRPPEVKPEVPVMGGFLLLPTIYGAAAGVWDLRHGLRRWAPTATGVAIYTLEAERSVQLLQSGLSRFRSIRLGGQEYNLMPVTEPENRMARRIFRNLDLAAVETLTLGGYILDAQAVSQLFASPMPNIQELSLSGCTLTGDALEALAQAAPPSLASLDLSGCNLRGMKVGVLSQLSVHTLRLQEDLVDPGDLQALRSIPGVTITQPPPPMPPG